MVGFAPGLKLNCAMTRNILLQELVSGAGFESMTFAATMSEPEGEYAFVVGFLDM
jgi:hypothetical protein